MTMPRQQFGALDVVGPTQIPLREIFEAKHLGVLIILLVYVTYYSYLILSGQGVPYVLDNNETFSSLNHAYNLWHFDFFKSFGLTDEAVSPDSAAHPFIHTHQGNFPRLFSFLLYALGARSAASQIWVTTFTVGVASALMAYAFFRRMGGELFATCAALVLITDYLMFAQWQVNTYRVWHGFFLFGALLCVHGLTEWRRISWVVATIVLYACLFYWELVFAFFVSVTVGLYTAWVYRRNPRLIVFGWALQGAGALVGLATVISQLVLYLGWKDFLTDLRLTVTARNASPDSAAFRNELRKFYESHNIAFFYNLRTSGEFAGLAVFLRSIFRNILQVPNPLLSLSAIALASAAFVADSRPATLKDLSARSKQPALSDVAILASGMGMLLYAMPGGDAVLGGGSSIVGLAGTLWGTAVVVLGLSAAGAYGVLRIAAAISELGSPPRFDRCILAAAFLWGLGLLIILQGKYYDQNTVILWPDVLTPFRADVAKVVVVMAALAGALTILAGRRATLGRWHAVPASIAPFLICGLLAYLAVYWLSSGYLHSGYLDRLAPLPVFHFDALLGFGAFVGLALCLTLAARTPVLRVPWTGRLASAIAALVTVAMVAGWGAVQLRYYRLLPPDQFAFVGLLEQPNFRGAGLVSNNYAVPFGFVAGTWAYIDNVTDLVTAAATGEDRAHENPYLWLADRSNPAYRRPDLYVCFDSVSALTGLVAELGSRVGACSRDAISRALQPPDSSAVVTPMILAHDGPRSRWAIVRLVWSAPDAATRNLTGIQRPVAMIRPPLVQQSEP